MVNQETEACPSREGTVAVLCCRSTREMRIRGNWDRTCVCVCVFTPVNLRERAEHTTWVSTKSLGPGTGAGKERKEVNKHLLST